MVGKCEILPPQYDYMRYSGTPEELTEVYNWVAANTEGTWDVNDPNSVPPATGVSIRADNGNMVISSMYGQIECKPGDYIVRDQPGMFGDKQFRPYAPEDFERSYRVSG